MRNSAFCPHNIFVLAVLVRKRDYLPKLHQQLVFIMEKQYVYSDVGTEYFSSFRGRHFKERLVSGPKDRLDIGTVHSGFVGDKLAHEFLPSKSGFPCRNSSSDPYSSLSWWCSTLIIRIDCEAQETSDTRQTVFFLQEGNKLGGKNSSTCNILKIINSFLGLWSTLSLQTRTVMSYAFNYLCSPPYWPCHFKNL